MSLVKYQKILNIKDLSEMKLSGEKISCLTAYDASFSTLLDVSGIDVLLVGDSLGMVIQGHSTTLPVTVEDMVYHTRIVASARKRAFVLSDLTFASYANRDQALSNAARIMQAGAQAVKLEGAKIDIIRFLTEQGIPVCGHLGLMPQSINQYGSYQVQGRDLLQAQRLMEDAVNIQLAGASLLVLECVPAKLATEICSKLHIPVIGIGAGKNCDGQVLVLYDMLGITLGIKPKFCKNFMADASNIENAIKDYHLAVKNQEFPGLEHQF
jgi:3-methyl-2-oxobutanoate hydroxymethyltransferase